jgi:hypothetical protein
VDGKHLDGGSELVADFVGKSPEGIQVGVILHCRGGQISELEVYALDQVKGAFGLPCPNALVAFGDADPEYLSLTGVYTTNRITGEMAMLRQLPNDLHAGSQPDGNSPLIPRGYKHRVWGRRHSVKLVP